jgi:hypothetical protein
LKALKAVSDFKAILGCYSQNIADVFGTLQSVGPGQSLNALQGALVDADGEGLGAEVVTRVIAHSKDCRAIVPAGQIFSAFFRLRWRGCGFITKLSRNNAAMNSDLATIVIGDFPSDAADFLRAEAEAAGTSLSAVCEGILLAYVEEQES